MEQRKPWTNSKAYFSAYGQLFGSTLGLPTSKQKSQPTSKKNGLEIDLPTERQEGFKLFQYSQVKKLPLVHTPNEGKRTSWQGAALKAQGLRAGFPDYTLYVPKKGYGALMIELKRQKGGNTSKNQQHWLDLLNKNGYLAVVCYGADEAIKVIEDYLK